MKEVHEFIDHEKWDGFCGEELIYRAGDQLCEGSSGVMIVRRTMNKSYLDALLGSLASLHWVDNHNKFITKSGVEIDQRRDTYGLDLTGRQCVKGGDLVRELAIDIENIVRLLAPVFASLEGWTANDVSLHRYDDTELGLSAHQDLALFTGVVAILSLQGSCDFVTFYGDQELTERLDAGDLTLMRVTGLIGDPNDAPYQNTMNVKHMIGRLHSPTRVSLVARSKHFCGNVPGFIYGEEQEATQK